MYERLGIDKDLAVLSQRVERELSERFCAVDALAEENQVKVLQAFWENRVSETHFAGSTGYGYNDRGRDVLDAVFASVFGAEDALVRHLFTGGTHALAVTLFGVMRPGQTLLSVTGSPYDTLLEVIGLRGEPGAGSLMEFGVNYREVALAPDGRIDTEAALGQLDDPAVSAVFIQRSRGYRIRRALSVAEIEAFCRAAKERRPGIVIIVDNCYGEFTEDREPCATGADLMVGSLIKNPGGGLADTGAYIAGRKEWVERCAFRLTSPGIGREVGATLNQNRNMFRGLFFAPTVTASALKTVLFASALFQSLGYEVSPRPDEPRSDIVQTIRFKSREALLAFCKGIQAGAPVDSFVTPEPWAMPGYDDEVVMASGSFVQGSSIELSADAPLREPYCVFMQGGLTYPAGKAGVLLAAQELKRAGLLQKG